MGINRNKAVVFFNTLEVLENKMGVLENKACLLREESRLSLSKNNFREFAAILPYTARKSFIQRAYRVVAATKSVAAKGHLA